MMFQYVVYILHIETSSCNISQVRAIGMEQNLEHEEMPIFSFLLSYPE